MGGRRAHPDARLAAASGLPYRRFLPWNLPSAAVWGTVMVLLGYAAGEAYQRVSWVLAVVAAGLLVLLVLVARRWLRRNPLPGEVVTDTPVRVEGSLR